MTELAAKIISRVCEPIIWAPLMIWLTMSKVPIPTEKKIFYYPILVFFVFVIPFGYFMYLVYVKKELDIDVTQREKRMGFTIKSMMSFAIAVLITYFVERKLFVIATAVFLSVLALIIITNWWKISFHGGLNTLIIITLNYLYNWRFWWVFLLLIPIGWARLMLKKHDLAQYFAGVLVCAGLFLTVSSVL